jgi:hypothetical protein
MEAFVVIYLGNHQQKNERTMELEEIVLKSITEKLAHEDAEVSPGKMMSAPGIKYKNKVFAFYYKQEMVFKLGKEFDPKSFGADTWRLLNPFKNKPPMSGWFQISSNDKDKWEALARKALETMKQSR